MSSAPSSPGYLRWFTNRSINVKVLSVIALLSVVAAVVGVLGFVNLNTANKDLTTLKAEAVTGLDALGKAHQEQLFMRQAIANYALSTTPEDKKTWLGKIQQSDKDQDADGAQFESAGVADPKDWAAFQDAWAQVRHVRDTQIMPVAAALNLPVTADTARATLDQMTAQAAAYVQIRDQVLNDLTGKGADALDAVQAAQVTHSQSMITAAESAASSAKTTLLVVLIVGLVLGVTIAVLVLRGIIRNLREVSAGLDKVAEGDLTVAVPVRSRDETGQMAAAVNAAVTNTREVVSVITESANALAAAAEQMTATSSQMTSGAQSQSQQAGVVAAAAEQVSANVATVATGTEEMSAAVREIAHSAQEAARVGQDAVRLAADTTGTVSKLGEASAQIDTVVKVITSIAEQTNLLALNATIEAARAGEAGKGFAVVANEVKELAQETAKATQDISARVAAIQEQTGSAVDAITRIDTVIGQINDFQTTIASAVEEQTATTNEMSRSVAEAATGSTEIAQNISGVATVAAEAAQSSGQLSSATGEVARMSAELSATVTRFRL